MKQIAIVVDEQQIDKVDEIASVTNQSRNFVIREAINIYINQYLISKEQEKKLEVG